MTHIIDKYYVHRDGGLYFALYKATDTRDQTPLIVYRHVYPFEVAIWVRPESEWNERFKGLTTAQAHEVMSLDRDALKTFITDRKKARKG